MTEKKYKSFKEFYPFYLNEHKDSRCRLMHVVGTTLLLVVLIYSLITSQFILLWLLPVIGYGFAWVGHFVFEKNRPATFTYPLYSFIGDWVMWWQVITFRIKI
ncbi:MAG: Mpo1-like protein [Marinicellaceae bacterium]